MPGRWLRQVSVARLGNWQKKQPIGSTPDHVMAAGAQHAPHVIAVAQRHRGLRLPARCSGIGVSVSTMAAGVIHGDHPAAVATDMNRRNAGVHGSRGRAQIIRARLCGWAEPRG
ncbi:hypothetical protein FQR65_LT21020 [Abscondita terminalis]|nr:hypothetical protein FQR65_LT21020 [Abscondita terminalis]